MLRKLQTAFKQSYWLNSIFFTLLQRFSTILFGLVTYKILAAYTFDNPQMGVWALLLMVTNLVEVVKLGLLRNATIKFLHATEYADNRQDVQSASLGINILFTVLVSLVIVIFNGAIVNFLGTPQLSNLLYLSVVIFVVQVPFHHCEIIQQANLQYQPCFWAYFLRQGLFFGGVIILMLFFKENLTFASLVWIQIISLIAGTIYFLPKTKKYLSGTFHWNTNVIKTLLSFGKYTFGTNLVSNLSRSLDHFITSNVIKNPIEAHRFVSYYNAVSRVNNMIDMPTLAVADIMFPKSVQMMELEGTQKVKYYYERMVASIICLLLPISIFIVLFPKLIIWIIADEKYYAAIPILQLSVSIAILRPFFYQFGNTLDAIGKPQLNFWSNTAFIIFNISLNYFFLTHYGWMGAAYASVVYHIVAIIAVFAILKWQIKIELKNIYAYVISGYQQIFAMGKKVLLRNP